MPPEQLGCDGILSLAFYAVVDAIRQARHGDPEEVAWLREVAPGWLSVLGIEVDPRKWAGWVDAGCPGGTIRSNLWPRPDDPRPKRKRIRKPKLQQVVD
jgi:hypothetical protein